MATPITKYLACDGSEHLTPEAADAVDAQLAYVKRVDAWLDSLEDSVKAEGRERTARGAQTARTTRRAAVLGFLQWVAQAEIAEDTHEASEA